MEVRVSWQQWHLKSAISHPATCRPLAVTSGKAYGFFGDWNAVMARAMTSFTVWRLAVLLGACLHIKLCSTPVRLLPPHIYKCGRHRRQGCTVFNAASSTSFWYQFLHFLFLHPSLLPRMIHHSVNLQLHLSFTPGLKSTSFTNPTPLSFISSSRTASTDFCLDRFFGATRFLILFFLLIFRFWAVR